MWCQVNLGWGQVARKKRMSVGARFPWPPRARLGCLDVILKLALGSGGDREGEIRIGFEFKKRLVRGMRRSGVGGMGPGGLRSCDGGVTARPATVGRPEGGMGLSLGIWLPLRKDLALSARGREMGL